jgi:hypothetical protein
MPKKTQDLEELDPKNMPVFMDKDLDEFGEFLEEFKEEKHITKPSPAIIHPVNIRKAMESWGATRNGKVVMEKHSSWTPDEKEFSKYDYFWLLFDAWSKRNDKRAYAEKKRLEDYSGLADAMRIHEEIGNVPVDIEEYE